LFNYQDVIAAAHDATRFCVSGGIDIPHLGTAVKSYPLEADPPDHAKYRRILQPHFTPAAVVKFEPQIRQVVTEHIKRIAPVGHAEVMSELARPIPSTIIALLLGISTERWYDLHHWTHGMIQASINKDADQARGFGRQLFEFMASEIEERKRAPRNDLLTAIASAKMDGADLPDEIRWGMAQVLMIAGHETTTNAIGNLIYHLACHPELQDPVAGEAVMRSKVIDESLRFESPVFGLGRTVIQDTEMSGTALIKGDRVLVCFGAANHDPTAFPEPEAFDPERTENTRHVAFGHGRHRCIGEHLARLEIDVVIDEFLRQIPHYRMAPGTTLEMKSATVRGPTKLEIVWDA
jgi:cytochrome P450